MSLFPVPVSGQPIPRGWFARLVRFINTLVLHGDGSYTQVKHTNDGTFVTLTPAAVDALNRAGGTPGGSGANQDLSVSVSGNTATIGLSGSTATAELVGTGGVLVTGGTNNQIILSAAMFPVWGNLILQQITPTWDAVDETKMNPIVLQYSGYLYITVNPTMEFDPDVSSQDVYCYVSIDNRQVFAFQRDVVFESFQGGDVPHYRIYSQDSDMIPVCAGSTVTALYYDSSRATQKLAFNFYHI